MIDLDREREAFIKLYSEIYGEHDQIWQGWKKRAELAQQEIESLASKHGSAIGKLHFTEKKLGEAQQEISQLKAKLAKYESDDVVVIPRELSEKIKNAIDVAIREANFEKFYSQDSVSHNKSGLVYQAMIEAGEIK
jgi:septal ring factor EnvC (AmiA/AmiB activator)